jgi:hypothetical protein
MANIRLIAEALIGLSVREVQGLAKVLKDDYGIVADTGVLSKDDAKRLFAGAKTTGNAVFEKRRASQRSKVYVPRVIGKPCKPFVVHRK